MRHPTAPFDRGFSFDFMDGTPSSYIYYDAKVLHPISLAHVVNLAYGSHQNRSICPKILRSAAPAIHVNFSGADLPIPFAL